MKVKKDKIQGGKQMKTKRYCKKHAKEIYGHDSELVVTEGKKMLPD